jgi:hypothetical protein
MTELLPAWAVAALRRPVQGRADARDRIMDRVRVAPMPSRAPLAFGLGRPGVLRMGVGLAAAASLAMVLAGRMQETLASGSAAGEATVAVIRDSIAGPLRDTLRLVRFVLETPAATRVALVGDFTQWAPAALDRERNGRWVATVALTNGRHAYAFVVDDTQRVTGPALTDRRLTLESRSFEGDSL